MAQPLWENLPVSYNGKYTPNTFDHSIPRCSPKGNFLKGRLARMCVAALFIIAPTWKQPKCSSRDEQLNYYIHTVEYCSALGTNYYYPLGTARH